MLFGALKPIEASMCVNAPTVTWGTGILCLPPEIEDPRFRSSMGMHPHPPFFISPLLALCPVGLSLRSTPLRGARHDCTHLL